MEHHQSETERRSALTALAALIRIGFGLEVLGRAGLLRPRLTALLLIVLTSVAVAMAARVTFDDEVYTLYRTDSVHYQEYSELVRLFPVVANQIVLLLEGDDVASREGLEALRGIHLDMQFIDGVAGVTSIFSVRDPPRGDAAPASLFPVDLPEGDELAQVLNRVAAHPLAGDRLITADRRSTLMVVTMERGADSLATADEIIATVDLGLAENAATLKIERLATGSPLLRREILQAIRRDQLVLNIAGTVIAITLCLLYFGRWRLALAATLPGVVGVVWTLAGFGFAGQSINALTNVLPTLVLVIAFADSLHMTNAVRVALGDGCSGPQAARSAVEQVGPACAMTSVTTSLVFLTLAISPSPAISGFGFAGAWAAAMAFVAVITIVPTVTALLLGPTDAPHAGTVDGVLDRFNRRTIDAVVRLIVRRPATIAGIGALVLVFTTAGYLAIEPRYGYRDFLPDRSDSNIAIDRIDAAFGGADSVNIIVRRTAETAPDAVSGVDAVRAAHSVAESTPPLAEVLSIKSVEDWLRFDMSERDGAASPADSFGIPDHFLARLKSPTEPAWLVTGFLPALDASQSIPIFEALDNALDPVRIAAPEYRFTVTGLVPMTAYGSNELISRLNLSLIAAIGVTIILIAITFRSPLIGLLVAIPNLLPLSVAGSFLYLSGMGLQITGVIALTIAFGIAVDDTIHLIHRWRLEGARAGGKDAVIRALARVGPVLIATTLVLIAGTAATAMSELALVRLFGGLCILIFAAALFADLLLMPALLMILAGRKNPTSRE